MITLNFKMDPYFQPQEDPDLQLALMAFSGFKGTNVFIVDGIDFSNSIPVLWFAWHLRHVYHWIHNGSKPYCFFSRESAYGFKFTKKDDLIEIEAPWMGAHKVSHGRVVYVAVDDLSRAVRSFYRRVYKQTAKIYPHLKTHQPTRDWLYSDLS